MTTSHVSNDEPWRGSEPAAHLLKGEPGGGLIAGESLASVLAQCVEHEGVAIHRHVVVAQNVTACPQDYVAVGRDKWRPGIIPCGGVGGEAQTRQRLWERKRLQGLARKRTLRGEEAHTIRFP